MNKNFRKKNTRDHSKSGAKLIMDEDNDYFDMDF
jgi:hypothetical protein